MASVFMSLKREHIEKRRPSKNKRDIFNVLVLLEAGLRLQTLAPALQMQKCSAFYLLCSLNLVKNSTCLAVCSNEHTNVSGVLEDLLALFLIEVGGFGTLAARLGLNKPAFGRRSLAYLLMITLLSPFRPTC